MKLFNQLQPALWAAIFFTYLSPINCEGLSCYQCTVAPRPGAKISSSQICSHFEESGHFQVYCPKSTLCMKKTIHHKLVNGTLVLTSVERGCAPQLNVVQAYDFDKKSWQSKEEVVTSAYREGCFVGEDRGSPGGPPEYCFCSYNLCNGSLSPINTYKLNIVFVGMLFWLHIAS